MEDRPLNEKVFMDMLAIADPSLWRVKKSLLEYKVNPDALPPIIEAIYHVYTSTKYGDVVVTMENGVITVTKGLTYRKVDIDAM